MKIANAVTKLPTESQLELLLLHDLILHGLPVPQREYCFAKPRRWRADFAWPEQRILVECEGATFAGGRHTRGAGYAADLEKYNNAALNGWLTLRFDGAMIRDGVAIQVIRQAFKRISDTAIARGIGRAVARIEEAEEHR